MALFQASLFKQSLLSEKGTGTLNKGLFKTLTYSDVESMELVKQCHFLELQYSTNFTSASEVLLNFMISLRSLKK